MRKTRELTAWLLFLIVNGVLLFVILLPAGADVTFDKVTRGSESAGLLFLGFFLIGLSRFVKRVKR